MDLQGKTVRPALKICGVTNARDLAHCLTLGVDYVGFNFHAGSKRHVAPAKAAELWAKAVRDHGDKKLTTRPVGVVVDAEAQQLEAMLAAFPALAVVQFHGREELGYLARQKLVLAGRGVWKAVAVRGAGDVRSARELAAAVDLVLFDAAAGGSGKRFDWELLRVYTGKASFGVAGGIEPGILAALARVARPALVDVASGVEASPGVKDPARVSALWEELQSTW